MVIFIVVLTGPKIGSKIRVSNGFTIGRKEGDLILEEDSKVSGTHAKVGVDNKGQFVLLDQNSANALILNARRVKKVALMPGVIFTIGQTQFRVIKDDSVTDPVVIKTIDAFEVPKIFEVPIRREPVGWREKVVEDWEQKGPMVSSPTEEFPIGPFSPALVLEFIEGVQADQKVTLGYGPRQAGFDHLDVDLIDPTVPREAFELRPGPGTAELLDLTAGQVLVNNRHSQVTLLEEGDIISVGQTKIKVRYL